MSESQTILAFFDHVCVKYGFCLPQESRAALALEAPYSADEIAEIIIREEGLDPDCEKRHFRDLKNAYLEFIEKRSL